MCLNAEVAEGRREEQKQEILCVPPRPLRSNVLRSEFPLRFSSVFSVTSVVNKFSTSSRSRLQRG